ncbi:hypothetical protein D3C71_2073510 [compost metagenome]
MWGKHNDSFYLISNCGNYTCTIERNSASFWRMKPTWFKLAKLRIGPSLQLTEKGLFVSKNKGGIVVETIELVLPEIQGGL